jgi:hypothetical protein
MAIGPTIPEYLKWSEVPMTFDRSEHPNFILKLGWYPSIISPILLIDGGSSLNILFLKTFD